MSAAEVELDRLRTEGGLDAGQAASVGFHRALLRKRQGRLREAQAELEQVDAGALTEPLRAITADLRSYLKVKLAGGAR